MKKTIAFIMALCLILCSAGCASRVSSSTVTLYDGDGELLATVSAKDTSDSFVYYALEEAISILSNLKECDEKEAKTTLFSGGYTIYTTADADVMTAVEKGYVSYGKSELPFGCAITDLSGNLLALYSGGEKDYANMTHSPHSTIKPLSVYALSVEEELIDWSTTIEDKPFKKLKSEDGELTDWPQNPTGTYTYQPTRLYDCISKSLNTTAVSQLKALGVQKSISFLTQSLGWELSFEQRKLKSQGDEEILGNIALGSLYEGVTPVQLAGSYQIFGNGGWYERPHAITEIRDSEGSVLYRHQSEKTKVISEDTATILNRILKGVTSSGGTGVEAKVKGAEVVGKTGTADNNDDNWFVGLTPQYSCAVWHGAGDDGNHATTLFSEIFKNIPAHTETTFKLRGSVKKVVLCNESGLQISAGCTDIKLGYFAANRLPAVCNKH